MKNVVAVCTEPEAPMRIITYAILLATICQAQVEFVASRPGNWVPTTPIFGVLWPTVGDTVNDRSIKNVGASSIVIQAVSMEIKSPGLEGEWWGGLSIVGLRDHVYLKTQRVQYKKVQYTQTNSLAPNSTARLNVSRLTDCYWDDIGGFCTVDRSVSPPDTLFKHNTANPVDTMDVRLGVYWRDASNSVKDSAYLDCRIEYRTRALTSGNQYRGSSPSVFHPVGVAGGWHVESGSWSLRHPDGREVPVERVALAEGLVVRPTAAFEGVGILHNAEGQAFRVVGVR
jgi:hypothetical protein